MHCLQAVDHHDLCCRTHVDAAHTRQSIRTAIASNQEKAWHRPAIQTKWIIRAPDSVAWRGNAHELFSGNSVSRPGFKTDPRPDQEAAESMHLTVWGDALSKQPRYGTHSVRSSANCTTSGGQAAVEQPTAIAAGARARA